MMPSPHGSGSGPRRSATLPINLEPRQRATPPASPSEMTHCLRGQANEMTSSPRSDRGTAEAAGVLPQASYHSFVENLDHRGRQYPHGNSRGHTMGARIDVHLQAHIAVFVPPGHNPHRGMPPISLNLATDPRTLASEPQTALSIGERTPIVESPRSYHDGTDVRSPATESTASDLSELGWPFRPS